MSPSLPLTLYRYISRQFLQQIGLVAAVVAALVLVVDIVELLRRSSGHAQVGIGLVIELAVLKLPLMLQRVLPFMVLIGGILCFSRLTRSRELVVARAAGISAWQFIAPALLTSVGLWMVVILALSPITATTLMRFDQLEEKYFKGKSSLLAVSSAGLWLRQREEDPSGKTDGADTIIHALRVSAKDMRLYEVIIYTLDSEDRFLRRVDAASAVLQPEHWLLENALVTAPGTPATRYPKVTLPTRLTTQQIQESFASPETLSFWELPAFIRTMEVSGFSALQHRLYWHGLMALPLLLCAMVLVGAVFSLTYRRVGHTGKLVAAGVGVGFSVYFLSDLIGALALSGALPPSLAAWSVAGVAALAGVITLLQQEDG